MHVCVALPYDCNYRPAFGIKNVDDGVVALDVYTFLEKFQFLDRGCSMHVGSVS